jgi:hypothetical protein
MYDGSVFALPDAHPNFTFQSDFIHVDNIMQHIEVNGHGSMRDMALKMDIEGEEWRIFDAHGDELFDRFNQISIELHHCCFEPYAQKIRVLKKLLTRYFVFHIHGNNHEPAVDKLPDIPEVTFIRRDCGYVPEPETERYPISGVDAPSNYHLPELDITWWI